MFFKDYSDSVYTGDARTLPVSAKGFHDNGWQIDALIHGDGSMEWISDFYAYHPTLGFVRGNFEAHIFATSEYVLNEFLKDFPFDEWNYEFELHKI